MDVPLISAAARPATVPRVGRRVPLASRAAAQHAGHVPAVLDRVVTDDGNAPGTSAFQSAL